MIVFWELLKILLPSVVVFLTAYYLIRLYTVNDLKKKELEARAITQKDILFLRLQAYERLILLMERITPASLIQRVDSSGLTAGEYHFHLITTIKAEFEHNLAQQLYVSVQVWNAALEAKEQILLIINLARQELKDDENVTIFSKLLLDTYLTTGQPAHKAIAALKEEAKNLF
jgi:hypothetical protein